MDLWWKRCFLVGSQHTFCPFTADPAQELRATLCLWQGQYCERQELRTSTNHLGISMRQFHGGLKRNQVCHLGSLMGFSKTISQELIL
jgi:hypothetical protein